MKEIIGDIDKTSYNRIHRWVSRKFIKTGKCFYCSKRAKTQWSNIDHKYSLDPSEWQEVCVSCHAKYDIAMGLVIPLGRRPLVPKRMLSYAWYKPTGRERFI